MNKYESWWFRNSELVIVLIVIFVALAIAAGGICFMINWSWQKNMEITGDPDCFYIRCVKEIKDEPKK